MVITFQDLTQVRALEETSRRQDRLAAIGRMAASIAHEIKPARRNARINTDVARGSGQQFVARRVDGNHTA